MKKCYLKNTLDITSKFNTRKYENKAHNLVNIDEGWYTI